MSKPYVFNREVPPTKEVYFCGSSKATKYCCGVRNCLGRFHCQHGLLDIRAFGEANSYMSFLIAETDNCATYFYRSIATPGNINIFTCSARDGRYHSAVQIREGASFIFADKQEESFERLEESLEELLYALICKIWGNEPKEEFDAYVENAQNEPEIYQDLQEDKWRRLHASRIISRMDEDDN